MKNAFVLIAVSLLAVGDFTQGQQPGHPNAAAALGTPPAAEPAKLAVLIVTGQNGHNWRATTPALRQLLEGTGRFEVRATEEFRGASAETLAPYDLVILNYYVLATAWDDPALYKASRTDAKAPQPIPGPGLDQPVAWTVNYGKGRVFTTVLGHDVSTIETPAFSTLFSRGAEWAATGKVTLPVPAAMAVGAAATLAAQGTKTGSPEQNLPSNITQLTAFGERASWSPDGRRIAFMSKSFGDAFVVDVDTKMVRLLTHYQNPGYLRVQYLPNGDFFLIGARTFTDIRTTRSRDQEMWVLKADGKGQPVPLDHKISEGVAISRKSAKIAWSNTRGQYPELLQEGESVIYTADIVESGGRPTLINKKEIIRARSPECTLEAQDFRRNDGELIYTCYRSPFADVFGIDLNTGRVTTYRKVADEYNEVEGVFPDGEHALVESSRDQSKHNSNYVDIWKLELEPNSRSFVRMTRWGDYAGYKASNPVVSPDGTTIAFQSARSSDPAGVGYGIFLPKTR